MGASAAAGRLERLPPGLKRRVIAKWLNHSPASSPTHLCRCGESESHLERSQKCRIGTGEQVKIKASPIPQEDRSRPFHIGPALPIISAAAPPAIRFKSTSVVRTPAYWILPANDDRSSCSNGFLFRISPLTMFFHRAYTFATNVVTQFLTSACESLHRQGGQIRTGKGRSARAIVMPS